MCFPQLPFYLRGQQTRKRQRESDAQTASSEQEAAGPQTTPMHEGAAAWDTWQREGTAPRSLSQQVQDCWEISFIEKC